MDTNTPHILPIGLDVPPVPVSVVSEMRSWALDCEWTDHDEIEDMDDTQIIAGVERHYDGGVRGFLANA